MDIMKNAVIFVITLLIGFGLGYLFFERGDDEQQVTENNEVTENMETTDEESAHPEDHGEAANEQSQQTEQFSAEGQILTDNGWYLLPFSNSTQFAGRCDWAGSFTILQ